MPNTNCRFAARALALALALLLLHGTAQAQNAPPPKPELSTEHVSRPAAGLTVTLPVGATASSYDIGGRGVTTVKLPGSLAIVNVSEAILTKAQTLPEVANSIIRQQLNTVATLDIDPNAPGGAAYDAKNTRGGLLSREARTIDGWPAEVFYLRTANLSGDDSAFGYAVFMPTSNTVAMLELQTTGPALEKVKPYFELMVGSVVIADPSLADAQRAMGVDAGVSFMQSLTPDDYKGVVANLGSDWKYERLYRPAESGSDADATELGYRRTRFALGTRGDLKAGEDRGRVGPVDRQQGYLVFQEVRILDADTVIDLAAGFFMTPDRGQEAWSIRQSVRPSKASKESATTTVETGARDRGDLTIARSTGGGPADSIHPAIEGVGYISRAEVYLLPYLLLRREAPGTYRFYAFNQSLDRVTLREDRLDKDPDRAGAWKYVSRPAEGSPGQTTYFDAKAHLVRAELPNGQLWEPVSLNRLYDLWKAKGLPLK